MRDLTCQEIEKNTLSALRTPRASTAQGFPEPLFSSEDSILWCRQAQYDYSASYEEALTSFLRKNNAALYICGHTPARGGKFRLLYKNQYLCIDTGMVFTGMGIGSVSALKIEDTGLKACYFQGRRIFEEDLFDISGT